LTAWHRADAAESELELPVEEGIVAASFLYENLSFLARTEQQLPCFLMLAELAVKSKLFFFFEEPKLSFIKHEDYNHSAKRIKES